MDRIRQEQMKEFQQRLVNELNGAVLPLSGSSPDLEEGELAVLDFIDDEDTYVPNNDIIGLGGATRGTKEFFEMKFRIFKYLVKHFKCRGMGFEMDFCESLHLDRFITTGEGNLRHILLEKVTNAELKTEEIKSMLLWMREYNIGKPRSKMLRFFGFDSHHMKGHADWLATFLKDKAPEIVERYHDLLETTRTLDPEAYESMSLDEWGRIWDLIDDMQWDILTVGHRYKTPLEDEEHDIAFHLTVTMKQVHRHRYNDPSYNDIVRREEDMGSNALWVENLVGMYNRIAVWSHNLRVTKRPVPGSTTMGRWINEHTGREPHFVAIGFSFSSGSFNAPGQDENGNLTGIQTHEIQGVPLEDSVNFIFHHADQRQFTLSLYDYAGGSFLWDWLAEYRLFLNVRNSYSGTPADYYPDQHLAEGFDVIFHFDETTATTPLK
jgi:erythromycin esterase